MKLAVLYPASEQGNFDQIKFSRWQTYYEVQKVNEYINQYPHALEGQKLPVVFPIDVKYDRDSELEAYWTMFQSLSWSS